MLLGECCRRREGAAMMSSACCAGTGAVEECFGCVGLRAFIFAVVCCWLSAVPRHRPRRVGILTGVRERELHMASKVHMAHGIEGAHVI